LLAWSQGDARALERLAPLVYVELRRLAHRKMRGERAGHLLQTTALVNEAYLRLVDCRLVKWHNRAQFFALSARLMRRILVDDARARGARKRGAGAQLSIDLPPPVSLPRGVDILALDEALARLAAINARQGQVVELRYFGGMTVHEVAEALNVSVQTVMRDWNFAKLWLLRALRATAPEPQ
jgi:RNA polymerase sigma factor (TIGR02999 family)